MGSFISRFGLVFHSDTSSAERGMTLMSRQLDMIQAQLTSMGGVAERLTSSIIGGFEAIGKTLVGTASKLETTKTKFEFAFRAMKPEEITKRWEAVELAGLKTVQSTNEVAESMALLQQMTSADVFGEKQTEALKKAAPTLTNFAELFGDISSSAQFGTRSATWGLKGLLQGEWGSAGKHLDAIAGKMDEYKKATSGAKDAQERLVKMMPLLVRDFGGASQKMGSTFAFLVDQLGDIKDKFFNTFGKGTMDQLKGPLKAFIDLFVGEPDGFLLPKNIKMFDKLVDVFDEIGGAVSYLAGQLVVFTEGVMLFVTEHPHVVKFGLVIIGLVGALSSMVVVLLTIKATVIAVGVAFTGWTLPLLAIGAGIVFLAYNMFKAATYSENLAEVWKKLKLLIAGAAEIVGSMRLGVGELSEQMTNNLAQEGLLDFVVGIGKFAYRVQRFFSGIADGFQDSMKMLREAWEPVMKRLMSWFGGVGDSAHVASSEWYSAGHAIARALSYVATVLGVIVDKVMAVGQFIMSHKTIIMGMLAGYGLYKAGSFAQGIVQKAIGGGSGDPGGPTMRVFVVNMPGGGFGGRGGGLPGAGGAAGEGPSWLAKTGVSLLSIFGAGGADGLLASAASVFATALVPLAVAAAQVKMLSILGEGAEAKQGFAVKQLAPDQARMLAEKAKKAEEEAPSHLSSGMQEAMRLEQERIARRRAEQDARRNGGNTTLIVNVDGTKVLEKRVETDADRSGQGHLVSKVP